MQYKDRAFVVRKLDGDISILPTKYLDELRQLSSEKLSGVKAQSLVSPHPFNQILMLTRKNIVHQYTYTTFVLESTLHVRVLQNKLTPNLAKYLDMAEMELDYGWNIEIPQPKGA